MPTTAPPRSAGAPYPRRANSESACGKGHRNGCREGREAEVVPDWQPWPVGQHGDEVRRPDGAAEGHTGDGELGGPGAAREAEGPLEQAGTRVGTKTAEDGDDGQQRVVVLVGDAEVELLHPAPPAEALPIRV